MHFHLAPEGSKRVQPGFPRQQPPGQDSDHRLGSRHGQSDLPQLLCFQGEGDTGNWTLNTVTACVIGIPSPSPCH